MQLGIQHAGTGMDGIVWNILGQAYTPLQRSDRSMAWHALFPPGTFVPMHLHHTQDEFVYVLDGQLDMDSGGQTRQAAPGDLLTLPMGQPHGLFNRGQASATCLFWVAPTARLWDLFVAIDNVPDPAEVVRLASLHDIDFLPPPA